MSLEMMVSIGEVGIGALQAAFAGGMTERFLNLRDRGGLSKVAMGIFAAGALFFVRSGLVFANRGFSELGIQNSETASLALVGAVAIAQVGFSMIQRRPVQIPQRIHVTTTDTEIFKKT